MEGIRHTRSVSHQIHSITFFGCKPTFGAEWWLISFSPRSFSFHIDINNPFFIARDYSFKKWIIFVAFEQRIADENAVH